jgi:hypothetical protein
MTSFYNKLNFKTCINKYRIKKEEERRMSTVYVIQDFGTWNLTPALEFGNIKVLLPARRQIIFSSAPTVNRLRQELREITDDDYLLLSGDPAAIGVASAIVSDYLNGKLNLLKWDKQERMYYPININLKNYGDIDE